MAKKDQEQNEEVVSGSTEEVVTITRAQLEQLQKASQNQDSTLASAIIAGFKEAQKPYKDEGQTANEKAMRDSMRAQKAAQDRTKKAEQEACPHKMACNPLSSTPDMFGRASFWPFRLDTGERILICSNCHKIVRQTDPDYMKYATMPTTNIEGSAGQRFFQDQMAAIKAGQS